MEQYRLILEEFKNTMPPARAAQQRAPIMRQPALDMPAAAPTRPKVVLNMPDKKQAEKLRGLADGLTDKIEALRADRQTNTQKRFGQAMQARTEADRLERTQQILRALADLHQVGTMPQPLRKLKTKKAVYDVMASKREMIPNGYHAYSVETGEPAQDSPEAREAWQLLKGKSPEQEQAEELERRIANLHFASIPGYFPTPPAVVERMIEEADIGPGMSVLEPSAGSGAIACAVEALGLDNLIQVHEVNPSLCEILRLRGFDARPGDFMEWPGQFLFDRVLMNPPFERHQDIDHVKKAFSLLKPGGILVAIMGEGAFNCTGRSKTRDFCEWLSGHDWHCQKLEPGTFKESGTMVASRLVVIHKPRSTDS